MDWGRREARLVGVGWEVRGARSCGRSLLLDIPCFRGIYVLHVLPRHC